MDGMNKILIEREFGAMPSATEMEVVDILIVNKVPKKSVKFLKPNRMKGSCTPDLLIDGTDLWEIKSIEKLGKYTIEHALRTGLKQVGDGGSLVLDLRKLSVALEKKAARTIESEFLKRKSWKGLVIIVRYDGKVLIFKK